MTSQRLAAHGPRAAVVRIFGAIVLALAIMLNAASAVSAQPACTTHEQMVKQLESKYSERRVAVALSEKGSLIEIYSSPDGATWTMVVTLIDGRSCILIAGKDWFDARQVAQGPQV